MINKRTLRLFYRNHKPDYLVLLVIGGFVLLAGMLEIYS